MRNQPPAKNERRSDAALNRSPKRSVGGRLKKALDAMIWANATDNEAAALEKAVGEARATIDEFNATARLSRVRLYIITGRIAPDDVEAVRAINSEISDLLEAMKDGIQNLDVKAVREAASRARNMGSMLTPEAAARIETAVATARSVARRIAKAGEQASMEVDRQAIARITEARTAFLDLDGAKEIATPQAEARSLDLFPIAPEAPASSPAAVPARAFEME